MLHQATVLVSETILTVCRKGKNNVFFPTFFCLFSGVQKLLNNSLATDEKFFPFVWVQLGVLRCQRDNEKEIEKK